MSIFWVKPQYFKPDFHTISGSRAITKYFWGAASFHLRLRFMLCMSQASKIVCYGLIVSI